MPLMHLQLAGEGDRVRTEVPLSEVPAGSVIVQVDCVDIPSIQERRGIGFAITDDGRGVCLDSDVAGTFEVKVVNALAQERAEERRQQRRRAQEQRQRRLAGRNGRGSFGGGTNQHKAVGSHYYGYNAYGHGALPFDDVAYHSGVVDWSGRWKAPQQLRAIPPYLQGVGVRIAVFRA